MNSEMLNRGVIMGFDPGLEIGEMISNQKIHDIFGVDMQQGIRTSKDHNYIVIVLKNDNGEYQDTWNDDGYRINYTGVGQIGDQKLNGRNKTLRDVLYNNKELFFFEKDSPNKYVYRGLCDLEDEPKISIQLDKNGNDRKVYVFPLKLHTRRKELVHSLEQEKEFEIEERKYDLTFNSIGKKDIKFNKKIEYKLKPRKKTKSIMKYGTIIYKRNKLIGINALKKAKFQCEYDILHESFIRKNLDVKYTEPHHLIPMSFSDQFDFSLDIEENIVSLCSDCHNLIHYGRDRYVLLRRLFEQRKNLLKQCGIEITFEELKQMYK